MKRRRKDDRLIEFLLGRVVVFLGFIFVQAWFLTALTAIQFRAAWPETPNELGAYAMLSKRRSIVNRGLSLNRSGLDP